MVSKNTVIRCYRLYMPMLNFFAPGGAQGLEIFPCLGMLHVTSISDKKMLMITFCNLAFTFIF